MSELNPDARRLVDLARQARTPGESDKLRIAERLAVPLATGAALGSAVGLAKAATGAEVASAGGWLSSLGAKVTAAVAVTAVGGAVVVSQLAAPAPEAQPQPTPVAPAPQQVTLPAARAPEPIPAAPEPAVSEPIVQPKASAAPSVQPAPELAQEAALLHEAQAAWRAGQSARALELASQHAQRFPRSQLANERDVLRVLSLCKLGQVQAAKQIGARLLSKAKGSPWYQSVAGSCAAE